MPALAALGALTIAALLPLVAAGQAAATADGTGDADPGAVDPSGGDLAPGGGRTIVLARPTWDTGWFQAAVVADLLSELGYAVDGPSTTEVDDFYDGVQDGAIDLWVNGWFPIHDRYLDRGEARARPIGVEVEGGALQGFAVDRGTATEVGLESLADLADPEVAGRFDADGDGRADLVGCNLDWACHALVEGHLARLDLTATVEQVSGEYGPLMETVVERHRRGEPVLYYTFTPNWTVSVLVPGVDVVWLSVPGDDGRDSPTMTGCADDPCSPGFEPSDIRAVANGELLDREPAIASLLSDFSLPLEAIADQNARMFRGEDGEADIERHAADWIERNRPEIDRWLAAATEAHVAAGGRLGPRPRPGDAGSPAVGTIRVAARPSPPYVTYDDDRFGGFSIDLLRLIADDIGADLDVYGVTSNAKLVDDVARGEADIGAGALAITSEREERIDFSQPYLDSGLEILVPVESGGVLSGRLGAALRSLLSVELLWIVLTLLIVLFVAAHVVWLAERRSNPEFPADYRTGIWEAFWWAAVTATTVGYGDTTPKGVTGRVFGLLWMFVGLFVLAYFTAGIASAFTVDELEGQIGGPGELRGHRVGVVADSLGADYVVDHGIAATRYELADEAYAALLDGSLDAVVHDAAVLEHFVAGNVAGGARVTGDRFAERGIGFAIETDGELAEAVNRSLIDAVESGRYDDLNERWFGDDG